MSSFGKKNDKGTILVTGANGSLGSGIVARIVSTTETAHYHGIYGVRNAKAAPTLKAALETGKFIHSHSYDIVSLELNNLANVRAVAASINGRVESGEIPPIRALVLNAGFLEFLEHTWTDDGFDMTFASNYLGHWLLAVLLLQSMDTQAGRIVIIGSESHDPFNSKNKSSFSEEKWMTFFNEDGCDPIARGTWSSTKDDPTFHSLVNWIFSNPLLLGRRNHPQDRSVTERSLDSGFRRYGASKFCLAMMM